MADITPDSGTSDVTAWENDESLSASNLNKRLQSLVNRTSSQKNLATRDEAAAGQRADVVMSPDTTKYAIDSRTATIDEAKTAVATNKLLSPAGGLKLLEHTNSVCVIKDDVAYLNNLSSDGDGGVKSSEAGVIEFHPSSQDIRLTGIAHGSPGRQIRLVNRGVKNLIIQDLDSGVFPDRSGLVSIAQNRIRIDVNLRADYQVVLRPGCALTLIYGYITPTSNKWIPVGDMLTFADATETTSGSANDVAITPKSLADWHTTLPETKLAVSLRYKTNTLNRGEVGFNVSTANALGLFDIKLQATAGLNGVFGPATHAQNYAHKWGYLRVYNEKTRQTIILSVRKPGRAGSNADKESTMSVGPDHNYPDLVPANFWVDNDSYTFGFMPVPVEFKETAQALTPTVTRYNDYMEGTREGKNEIQIHGAASAKTYLSGIRNDVYLPGEKVIVTNVGKGSLVLEYASTNSAVGNRLYFSEHWLETKKGGLELENNDCAVFQNVSELGVRKWRCIATSKVPKDHTFEKHEKNKTVAAGGHLDLNMYSVAPNWEDGEFEFSGWLNSPSYLWRSVQLQGLKKDGTVVEPYTWQLLSKVNLTASGSRIATSTDRKQLFEQTDIEGDFRSSDATVQFHMHFQFNSHRHTDAKNEQELTHIDVRYARGTSWGSSGWKWINGDMIWNKPEDIYGFRISPHSSGDDATLSHVNAFAKVTE